MKKRFLGILIAVCIISGVLLPVCCYAEGGDYVSILSVSPSDAEKGVETTFTVEVEYYLVSTDRAYINLGLNNISMDRTSLYGEETVGKGKGRTSISITTVVPTEWNAYISAVMSDINHGDNWEPLASDRMPITGSAKYEFEDYTYTATSDDSDVNKVIIENNLQIGKGVYIYREGGLLAEANPGAIGGYEMWFWVYGPKEFCHTFTIAARSTMPSNEQIEKLISDALEERNSPKELTPVVEFPTSGGIGGRPLWENDIGSVKYLIVAGLDINGNPIGYAVIKMKLSAEDGKKVEILPMDKKDTFAPSEPLPSLNAHRGNYIWSGDTVKSYLYQEGDELVRVEYAEGDLVVEKYTNDFRYISSKIVRLSENTRLKYGKNDEGYLVLKKAEENDKPVWGGFFHGKKANYVFLGWENKEENSSAEVFRVIKFDEDFNYVNQSIEYGANTMDPFGFASLRCAEAGDMIYTHTGHQMFKSSDGVNHQANMFWAIKDEEDEIEDNVDYVSFKGGIKGTIYPFVGWFGYVSHSFNQFILMDRDGNLVTLDHGDGYPRSVFLQRYKVADGRYENTGKINICEFPGAIGDNTTGASVGGLAETETGYVTAYNYNGVGANSTGSVMGIATPDPQLVRNIYVSYTAKNNFSESGTKVIKLTDFENDGKYSTGTPTIVPTGLDGGYIIWETFEKIEVEEIITGYETNGKLSYARYTADGNVGEVKTLEGVLSDCQPVSLNGKVVWYTTGNGAFSGFSTSERFGGTSSKPVFYVLDDNGVKSYSVDGASDKITVKVNGTNVDFTDVAPFIDENSRTMVPLRAVADAFGLSVSWDAASREAVFTDGAKTIYFPIGSVTAHTDDGETVEMDTAAVIVKDRTYAPVRYLANYFGHTVEWDAVMKTVIIK